MASERQAQYQKPLPEPSDVSRPFWQGLARGELWLQRCQDCHRYVFYPRPGCPHCLSESLRWVAASGRGRVYSFTVVRRAMHPAFQGDVPYLFAIVELEEGPRMTTNIVNCPLEEMRVEMPVRAIYDKISDEIALLKFEPE